MCVVPSLLQGHPPLPLRHDADSPCNQHKRDQGRRQKDAKDDLSDCSCAFSYPSHSTALEMVEVTTQATANSTRIPLYKR